MKEKIIDNHENDWNVYQKIKQIIKNRQVVYGDMPGLIDEISRIVSRADIDQYDRIAISVIKKKLWNMRYDENEVKNETDLERKQFMYGYTEAINVFAEWLMGMSALISRSRLTNNSQKTEGGE